jgi:hypothetical protein
MMTIPIPTLLDFQLHATVLGHPATVALRREVLGKTIRYSYEYRIDPKTTRIVGHESPTGILFAALDALAAGSYPKIWLWQRDIEREKEPKVEYDIDSVEAHFLIGPASLDRSMYDDAIKAVAAVQDRIRNGDPTPCEQHTRRDLRPEVAAALLETGPGSLVVDFLETWRDITQFSPPGIRREGHWSARYDPSDHSRVIVAVALASEQMERAFEWPAFVGLYDTFRIVSTF